MHVIEHNPKAAETVILLHGGNVAGWMWDAQVHGLADYHVLVPDLPGFGASNHLPWQSLADTADQVAELIRARAHGGEAHVVGLSLGAILGTVLLARHPEVARSGMLTGAALQGVRGFTRWTGLAQLRFWKSPGYWKLLARAFRIPADAVDAFVETGLGIDADSIQRLMTEVYDGGVAAHLPGLVGCDLPILALAGEREHRIARDSFPELTSRATTITTRVVPKMHHAWNAEDPELFNRIMREWLVSRTASAELLDA
jgi:pimeloyl-ACP methyl ester carboxylesterase